MSYHNYKYQERVGNNNKTRTHKRKIERLLKTIKVPCKYNSWWKSLDLNKRYNIASDLIYLKNNVWKRLQVDEIENFWNEKYATIDAPKEEIRKNKITMILDKVLN